MKYHLSELPLRRTARISGLLYLTIIVTGIFAEFFVRMSIIVPNDAGATVANIVQSEGLFRVGLTADLIMILSDVALAVAFFVLLMPVSMPLSLLAAFFRLAQASILGMNLLNLFIGLQLAHRANLTGAPQTDELALLFLDAHGTGYVVALSFFGVSILVLGYLIYKAQYIPAILGVLMMVASVGYLTDTFANFLLPNYATYETIFAFVVFVPALIAELAMALWLLVKGVKQPLVKDGEEYSASTEARYA